MRDRGARAVAAPARAGRALAALAAPAWPRWGEPHLAVVPRTADGGGADRRGDRAARRTSPRPSRSRPGRAGRRPSRAPAGRGCLLAALGQHGLRAASSTSRSATALFRKLWVSAPVLDARLGRARAALQRARLPVLPPQGRPRPSAAGAGRGRAVAVPAAVGARREPGDPPRRSRAGSPPRPSRPMAASSRPSASPGSRPRAAMAVDLRRTSRCRSPAARSRRCGGRPTRRPTSPTGRCAAARCSRRASRRR